MYTQFGTIRRVLGAVLLGVLAAVIAAPVYSAPTVDGRFFGSGDHEIYELQAISIGGSGLYTYRDGDTLYVALVVDRSVNDNVFDGGNSGPYMQSAGWTGARNMQRLIDSEYAEFTLIFGEPGETCSETWVWKQGYAGQPGRSHPLVRLDQPNWISDTTVSGGGGISPPSMVSASSLQWNINEYITIIQAGDSAGWVLGNPDATGNNQAQNWLSPRVDGLDTVQFTDSGYPAVGQPTFIDRSDFMEWEWSMVYEWSVDLGAIATERGCPAGAIPESVVVKQGASHHSPSKTGPGDDIFVKGTAICPTDTDNPNPVRLIAEIPQPDDPDAPAVAIDSIEFQWWQIGVSTGWTSATGFAPSDYSDNPVLVPEDVLITNAGGTTLTTVTQYILDWDTSGFTNLDDFPQFEIRAVLDSNLTPEPEPIVMGLDFSADECQTSQYPVTLASFASHRNGNQVTVEWWTETETANMGFNLYGEQADGSWRRINDDMIPSEVIDSFEPQFYSFSFSGANIRRLMLEDVDTLGRAEMHGPFDVGVSSGRIPEVEALDWANIRAQNNLARNAGRPGGWRQQNYDPVRLLVDEDGVYRFTHADLLLAGMDLTGVPVAHISLTNRGEPVPFYTEARGIFRPGDFIEFFGQAMDTLHTGTNVYLLHVDNRTSRRMKESNAGRVRGPLATTYASRFERAEPSSYQVGSLFDTPWVDTRLLVRNNRPVTHEFTFELDHVVGGSSATLDLEFYGTNRSIDHLPDHHVQVFVNGQEQVSHRFNGRELQQLRLALEPGLVSGTNVVTLRLPGDTGAPVAGFDLRGFSVEYKRELVARDGALKFTASDSAFEVRGLQTNQPVVYRIDADGEVTRIRRVEVEGRRAPFTARFAGSGSLATYVIGDPDTFAVPGLEPGSSTIDIVSGQADYLMISHPAFIDGLAPLVAHHEAQGRVVRVVDVKDIFDQFSYGLFDPLAIQAYIRATAASMGYDHVLLVGSDTTDYRNFLGSNSVSFIPSLYVRTGPIVAFAPADALFVDLDDNGVADLPIGRLPVRTPVELEEMIAKILEYAGRVNRDTAVLASDKREPQAVFSRQLNQITADGLADWDIRRIDLDRKGVNEARSVLFDGIADGSSLTAYLGHSSQGRWSFEGLFNIGDVSYLTNFGRPTVVTQFGCWNTYHVSPSANSLGHRLMAEPDRGAALVMGSATLTNVASGLRFGRLLMPELLTPGQTVGQAVTAARQQLAAEQPDMLDMILGWTILGDPAIVIVD